ncbi:MAG: Crp/Fnr family transcriptional regulator [Ramlibacter sp.]
MRCHTDVRPCLLHSATMESFQNELMAGLGPKARGSLLARCESVSLSLSQVLGEAGDPIRHVYFPVEGMISLVASVDDSPGIEVGMIGSEGMLGAPLALDVAVHPVRAVVQGSGAAWRIAAPAFRAQLELAPQLRRAVRRYVYVLLCQQSTASVCLRFHVIGPRLARWLLMSQDRAHSSTFPITQEFLSYMMGVRRAGVTNAAASLQRKGLIAYRRGKMQILDRAGLEAAACGCYAAERAIYANVLAG